MTFTYLFDLEPLEDVSHLLVFEDEPSIFDEKHSLELIETALHLMEEYMEDNPTIISEPTFHEILLDEIKEMFYVQMEDHMLDSDYVESDMDDLIEYAFHIYITTFHPERSIKTNELDDCKDDSITNEEFIKNVQTKIEFLRNIPQPVQRTKEWYEMRWNLITASNAWKAFESQSTINQLIYEKCQPLKNEEFETKMINTNTTLHWGQKYEPLSAMIYEFMYDSKIDDFGCIQHPIYNFLGASPDGIVVHSNTDRYGRMLEIKNIVNREINGIPKKEYWIQMQLQMEVCDLDECDFLETKFTEYSDFKSFEEDSYFMTVDNKQYNSHKLTSSGDFKGIIIQFHKRDGTPHYEYMPLNLDTPEEVSQWEEYTIQKFEAEPYSYMFLKFIYWKLEKVSCVLVKRNREWFKNNIKQLENVWNIILQERITGYQHRAPNKKVKKEPLKPQVNNEVCFLKVVKLV